MLHQRFKKLNHKQSGNFIFIAGPLIIENKEMPVEIARVLQEITNDLEIPFIFKASYKRINSALDEEFKGIGAEPALKLLKEISQQFKIPVQTDVYSEMDAFVAAKYADVLQIPAFLFRDTDLLNAAAKTGKYVNIRKSITSHGSEMSQAVSKVRRSGYNNILLTERGTMVGYHDVVIDYRNIAFMKRNNTPVLLDISSALSNKDRQDDKNSAYETALLLSKAGFAAGINGITIDTHLKPGLAKNRNTWYMPLIEVEGFLRTLKEFYNAINAQ